jgi:hypothetical protein
MGQSTALNVVTVSYSKPVCRTVPFNFNAPDWTVKDLSTGLGDIVIGDNTPICNVAFSNAVTSARLFLLIPPPPGAPVEVTLNELVAGAGSNPNIRDASGNLIVAPQVRTAAAAAPPTTPPTITSAAGPVGTARVTINFSEPVFCPTGLFVGQFTLNSGSPALTDPTFTGFGARPCAPTQNTAASSFDLTTSLAFPASTTYTLTFTQPTGTSGAVKNIYNVALPSGSSVTFTTGAADVTPPVIVDSRITNKVGPSSDFVNASDAFALTFSKKMASPVPGGSTISVQDQDGTTATIACGAAGPGQGPATCTFDTTNVTVLTVTLTAPLPSSGGTTPGLAIPFNITATTGITDASGNVPNILGSPDRLVRYK